MVFIIISYRTLYTKVMTNPTNPTTQLWRETCPDQLVGLVDAVRLCNQQVKHPLVLSHPNAQLDAPESAPTTEL